MREIVSEVPNTDSVTYMFDDSSVVWVVLQQGGVVNSNTYEMARRAARNFLNNLNPPARWEGKIDGAGNILESPIKL